MKKYFRVPIFWEMYGHVWVEAENEEEAIQIALDPKTPLPDGDYVEGSCAIDTEWPIEVDE